MNNLVRRAEEIVANHTMLSGSEKSIPYCCLGMIDVHGGPTVSAITAAKSDGIRSVAFCTGLSSNKVARLKANDRASVCFCSEEYNVTLTGRLTLITDPEVKKEMWYAPLSHHFSGPEDLEYCVLMFYSEGYNLLIDGQEARGVI